MTTAVVEVGAGEVVVTAGVVVEMAGVVVDITVVEGQVSRQTFMSKNGKITMS